MRTLKNIKEQEAKVYQAQIKEQALLINQQEMEFKMLASSLTAVATSLSPAVNAFMRIVSNVL